MSGYTRQSTADIVPTSVVRAAPINAEYNKLRDAFKQSDTGTTGHKHDGTSDEGSYVPLIADIDGINKIQVDGTNNRFGIYVEVSGTSTEQLRVQDGVVVPVTDNDIDLGTSSLEYKDGYFDGTLYADTLSAGDTDNTVITDNAYTVTGNFTMDVSGDINLDADGGDVVLKDGGTTYATFTSNTGNLTLKSGTTTAATFTGANVDLAGTLDVTGATTLDSTLDVVSNATVGGTFTVTGNTTLNSDLTVGDAVTDTLTVNAKVGSNFVPTTDATYDLGSASLEWNNLYLDGTAIIDTLQVDENASVTGNLSVAGNTSTTGNNTIGGTLGVTGAAGVDGNFDVNTDKFTVNATSGNTTIAGTLGVTGMITGDVTGDLTGNVTASSGTTTLNNLTVNGTVDFTNTTLVNVSDPTQAQHAATKNYVDTEVANLVSSAPDALNTLNELADALGDDPNFSTTVTNSIATKLPLAGGTMTGAIAMGTNKITGLGTPTADSDAATKGYIDTTFGSTTAAAASATAAAASATSAANSYDQFDDRYLGAKATVPTVDNDGDALITGALFFDTTAGRMKVYDGSVWIEAGSAVNATSERQTYTATSGQTSFTATYDVGYVDVWLNGVKLLAGTDFTATSGTSIVLTTGATTGDIVDIVAWGAFEVADVYTKAASDARYARLSNNLSDLTSAATARTNLGVAIGTDVLAYDANLQSFVTALTLPTADGTAGQFLKTDGAGTVSFASIPTINTLNDVGNVTITSAASGEFLKWNGSAWVNATVEAFDTQTHTTTATTEVSIAEYAHATYDGVKAVITADDGTDRSITEILITHDGTTAIATEYAQVNTGTALATFDVDISGTDIRILATPAAATSTAFTVKAITL
jgi:hypothetical protein